MNEHTDVGALGSQPWIDNRYRLLHLLRAGGMSQIYLAEDTRLFHRQVVVKRLTLPTPETDPRLRRWFDREARISSLLGHHPRIVTVLDYGMEQDYPYLVMEYLGQRPQGCDLEDYLAWHGPLAPAQVVHLGNQICSGLAYAHQFTFPDGHQTLQGVIHRDLKPSNLFIIHQEDLGETVKILDFGIAKIRNDIQQTTTSHMGFVGTLAYASPEQLRGEILTPSSDIYSLGVVLYKMLTGTSPFLLHSSSFQDWYRAHTQQDPLPFRAHHSLALPPTEIRRSAPPIAEGLGGGVRVACRRHSGGRPEGAIIQTSPTTE